MANHPHTILPTQGGTRRKPGLPRAVAMAIVGLLCLVRLGASWGNEVPASRQVLIVMRALAYDANLKSRAGETINIAVIHRKGSASSEQSANDITRAFGPLQATLVAGLPVVVSHLTYAGPEGLRKAIAGAGIDLLYVCDGFESDIPTIREITRESRVLTVGTREEYVEKGLSFGVFEIDGKSTIVLNLSASRNEGAAFASDLLRLAKVIR